MDHEDVDAVPDKTDGTDAQVGTLSQLVNHAFTRAKHSRKSQEQIWSLCYKNFQGIYDEELRFSEREKSQVFVKVTKTKVIAAAQQVNEVLLGNGKLPITIEPKKIPDGVADEVHVETDPNAAQLQPGETSEDFFKRLGALRDKLEKVPNLKEGPAKTPTQISFEPAQYSAKKMQMKIQDQLYISDVPAHIRKFTFELALFGTGIMKGPLMGTKEVPKWEGKEYKPEFKDYPIISHVSIWDFYPDPEASCIEDCLYIIQRHKLSETKLRDLKKRPHFRKNAINEAIVIGPSYHKEYWEHTMERKTQQLDVDRFEVLEYWGTVSTEKLVEHGLRIPKNLKDKEELSVNIWYCNGVILRCVLNPFKPARIPYYVVPYEVTPYSIWGVGLAENMQDTQLLMNGFMRLAVDNGVLSGNLVFEVDEANLADGQNTEVWPGKVFVRSSGAPGQSIFGINFPNTSAANMQMFDKARVLADESTGFPSFAHGQTGVTGIGRTSSGISMLMNAASGAIKSVIENIDDYLLSPLGSAMFAYNMQFDDDPEIKGDLEVKATGTKSLMAAEVRSQRLMQFLQVISSNPALAPFGKMEYLVREIATTLDLDPDKVVNSMAEAQLQAMMLQGLQPEQPQQGGPPAGVGVEDTQGGGGGTIGIGTSPTAGEQGFTGTPQEQGPAPDEMGG